MSGKPSTLTGQVAKRSAGAVWCLETESPEGAVREAKRPARPIAGGVVESRVSWRPRPRAGVRVPIVALKPGNVGGAKGGRKVET